MTNYGKSGVFSETHFFIADALERVPRGLQLAVRGVPAGQQQCESGGAARAGRHSLRPASGRHAGHRLRRLQNSSGINSIGVAAYVPSDELQNVLQIIDNVSKVWGRHSLKFGVNFQHVRFYGLQPPNGLGSENFNGTYTSDPGNPSIISGSSVADFMLNQMNNSSITSSTPSPMCAGTSRPLHRMTGR